MSEAKVKRVQRSRSRSRSHSPVRMSSMTNSPRFDAGAQKTSNKKVEKKREFDRDVNDLIKQYTAMIKLHEKYANTKSSHQLVFGEGDETRILTRPEVSSADAEFKRNLLALKKKCADMSKHSRTKLHPNEFKGPFNPVKVGLVFTSLFTNKKAKFGFAPNADGTGFSNTNLMDDLPMAKNGYLLLNSVRLLMYIYTNANDMKSKEPKKGQINIPDNLFNEIFGKLPALYYDEPNESNKNKNNKVLMDNSGHEMTTYDVISNKIPKFNRNEIANYFLNSLVSLNVYTNDDLSDKDSKFLSNENNRAKLLREYEIIESANKLYKPKK